MKALGLPQLAKAPEGAAATSGPTSGRQDRTAPSPPDPEALLVALTLSPATYSRNRFFEMHRSPDVQRARRRASQIRGVVTALASEATAPNAGRVLSLDGTDDGGAVLVYDVASVGMRRTVRLRSIELALLRYCLGRARSAAAAPPELLPRAEDGERIGLALQRLSPVLPSSPPSNEV